MRFIPTPGYHEIPIEVEEELPHISEPEVDAQNAQAAIDEEAYLESDEELVRYQGASSSRPHEVDPHDRVIIRPFGRGWVSNNPPISAIGHAIRSQFQGPYYLWEVTPQEVRDKWWAEFTSKVTWDPSDEA